MIDRVRARATAACVLAFALTAPLAAQERGAAQQQQEQRREEWQKVSEIFAAMGIGPGSVVADVGAGGGFFTVRLARAVEATGRVYAVDVNDRTLERLRARVSEEGLTNVEIVSGEIDDPRLPAATLDAALIVNAYHEMTEHQAMLARIRAALKPDGRLVIVEPISPARRDDARDRQTRNHEIGAAHVIADAGAAGFRIARLEDPFTSRRDGQDVEWLMVLQPSASAPPDAAAAAPPRGRSIEQAPAGDDWKSPELRIAVEEFKRLFATGEVLVLDVRDPQSYREGHLPGAILAPPDTLEARAAEWKNEKRPIVTYCS
jgi:predicted methyltransferase